MQRTKNYKLRLIEMSDTFSTEPLNQNMTDLDDALAALGGLRCVPLRWEGGSVLLTTPADSRQQEILESV